MRWSRVFLLIAAGAIVIPWIAVHAQQSAERPRFVLTERVAFLLSDPELVAPPVVTQAKWSPDARYVLAVREHWETPPLPGQMPTGEVSLVLWNSRTRRAQELWVKPVGSASIEQIEWLPGGDIGFAVARWLQPAGREMEAHRALLRIDAARASARAIAELGEGEHLQVSPAQPLAILHSMAKQSLRFVRADGSIGPVVALTRISVPGLQPLWSQEGSLLLQGWGRPPEAGQRPEPKWFAVDERSGEIRALATAPTIYRVKSAPLPVSLKQSSATLKEGNTTQAVQPLWLEGAPNGELPRVLVCADADWAQLAPNASAVLYKSQGAVWAAPLLRVPRESFLQARRAALRQVAVSNAKQIGLSLRMYLQDYDETFPPASQVNDRLMPYLKNGQVFNTPGSDAPGFVYLQDIGPLSGIKEPSKTRMGYLAGPGGRAVIYVDGHVEWQDN